MKNNKIVRGPSKYTLSVSFFDLVDGHRRPVEFEMINEDGQRECIRVVINKICWEDGSGNNFCFEGCVSRLCSLPREAGVNGYFNTERRLGWIVSGKSTW